jgi:hypothetical protein
MADGLIWGCAFCDPLSTAEPITQPPLGSAAYDGSGRLLAGVRHLDLKAPANDLKVQLAMSG